MEDAPYQSALKKWPSTSWTKAIIIQWSADDGINYGFISVTSELLNIAGAHKRENKYVIDELLYEIVS